MPQLRVNRLANALSHLRRYKAAYLAALGTLIFLLLLPMLDYGVYEAKDWIKFRLYYRDYLEWKKNGGPYLDKFGEPIQLDRYRDDMVKGLSYDQIRSKFPNLADGDQYLPAKDSYKGDALRNFRRTSPEAHILWLHKDDDWDMGIFINREGNDFILCKG